MKKIIVIIAVLMVALLIGCQQKTSEVVCNEPYILVGTDCCLDEDNNKICDNDEKTASLAEDSSPVENVEVIKDSIEKSTVEYIEDYSVFLEMSREKCLDDWPNDFFMREYCEGNQIDSYNDLMTQPVDGMSQSDFEQIKEKCLDDWPNDFFMREYCEGNQIDSWENLNQ